MILLTMHISLRRVLQPACLVLLAWACGPLWADESEDGALRLSGFGSMSAVRTSKQGVRPVYDLAMGGVDTARWNAAPESKLAVQARYQFSDDWSAVAQLMSKRTLQGDFKPRVEWAFAKWDPSPDLSFRAGRIGVPLFMISDARDVGYANTLMRPPLDVYEQAPFNHYDGAEGSYRRSIGEGTIAATLWMGSLQITMGALGSSSNTSLVEVTLKAGKGANLVYSNADGLTLRAGFAQALYDAHAEGLDALPDDTRVGVEEIFFTNGRPITFSGLGAAYDHGGIVLGAEYTRRQSDTVVPDTAAWYVSTGYRIGRFTPYMGWSRQSVLNPNTTNLYAGYLSDPGLMGQLANGVQRGLNALKTAQHTRTLGLRWDPVDKLALKAQWDHIDKPAASYGTFVTPSMGSDADQHFFSNAQAIEMFSVSLDFVF